MANELVIHYPTGATLYALLFDATGQIWNGSTFAAPGSASWTDYAIAMSEVATSTGIYRASMPAAAAGAYGWVVRKQAGGSPAVGDITVGTGEIRWTGTAEETVPPAVNVTMQAGVAVAPADANGNIPVNIKTIKGSQAAVDGLAGLSEWYDAESYVTVLGQDIRDAMKLAPSAGAPAAGSVDAKLDDILEDTGTTLPTAVEIVAAIDADPPAVNVTMVKGLPAPDLAGLDGLDGTTLALEATAQAVLAVIGAGSGTGLYTDTITNGSAPLDGVRVQLSTDEAGEHRVYETFTNALGVFVLRPDPGTYYRWLDLAGITFEQGVLVEVEAL